MVEATEIKSESVSGEEDRQHTYAHIVCNGPAYSQTTGAVHMGIACRSNRQRA